MALTASEEAVLGDTEDKNGDLRGTRTAQLTNSFKVDTRYPRSIEGILKLITLVKGKDIPR